MQNLRIRFAEKAYDVGRIVIQMVQRHYKTILLIAATAIVIATVAGTGCLTSSPEAETTRQYTR